MQKRVLEVLKTWYFPYSAFWSAGQWGGGAISPPRPPPGYATDWKRFLVPQRFILIVPSVYKSPWSKNLFQYIMFCNRSFSYFLKLLVKQLVVMNIINFFHPVSDIIFQYSFFHSVSDIIFQHSFFRAVSDIICQYYINVIAPSF